MTTPTDRPNLDRLRSPISFAELAVIAKAQKAALTDVLAYAAQLDRQPMGDLIADEIRDCITAHLDLTNGAER